MTGSILSRSTKFNYRGIVFMTKCYFSRLSIAAGIFSSARIGQSSLVCIMAVTLSSCYPNASSKEDAMKTIDGSFEVNLSLQDDGDSPVGRMLIHKTYKGSLEGIGIGQMISKRTDNGSAAYVAIEDFTGVVDGKKGSFTLLHKGLMTTDNQSLDISILKGSGSGELENILGEMTIIQEDGNHNYRLSYSLAHSNYEQSK
jgi:hypothetical protein